VASLQLGPAANELVPDKRSTYQTSRMLVRRRHGALCCRSGDSYPQSDKLESVRTRIEGEVLTVSDLAASCVVTGEGEEV